MALQLPASSTFTRFRPTSCSILASGNGIYPFRVICMTTTETSDKAILRRFANYRPSMRSYDYVQSLTSRDGVESHAERIRKLKEDVRLMLDNGVPMDVDPLHHLELIDTLQRLGVSYHFEIEIERTLDRIYNNNNGMTYHDKQQQECLHAVALGFRLLRQHGYEVSAKIFSNFRDQNGKSKLRLSDDCKEILALHEAAYLLVEEESDLFHEVINFTTTYLKEHLKHINDEYLSKLVSHSLELPLHWRMLRLEARWFIDVYEKAPDMHPVLLQLAKLDFDIVQASHQEDLKHASRWWTQTGLAEKLFFATDRIIENFLWAMGELSEPQFGYCRRMSTKVNSLITIIRDVYDVYGTIDELELFTEAVDRWDINATDQLPYYMKLCFHVLHSSINEIAFEALKEQGVHVIPYLKKVWADMGKSFLLEAKWHKSGYIPTFQEYIDNAWISVSGPVILMHAYILTANPVTKEALQFLETYPNVIRWPSMIFRLANDLATSSDEIKRGDVPKAIQCYMHEIGVSEEDTREHIRYLIAVTWMKMNRDGVGLGNPHLPNTFIRFAMNLARIAQCTYQNGDGHTVQNNSKDRVLSLLIRPVS